MISFPTSGAASGAGAAVDGSNITTPATWRGNLSVYSKSEAISKLAENVSGGLYMPSTVGQRITCSAPPSIAANSIWARIKFACPISNPSSTQGGLFSITSSASGAGAANALVCYLDTNGYLYLFIFGAGGTGDARFLYVPFVATYGGQIIDLVVCRDAATPTALVWINGVPLTCSESTSGTPPTWAGSITSTYIHVACVGSRAWLGDIYEFQMGQGVLNNTTAAQLVYAGCGTGSGAATGTPISRGGAIGSSDGLLIDVGLDDATSYTYYDQSGNGYVFASATCSEIQKNQNRLNSLNYSSADRRFSGGCANGAASVTSYGDTLTVQGTPSSSAADANQPQCVNCASAASAGSLAGYYSSAIHYVGRNPRLAMLVRLVELTNVAVWCGFQSGNATGLNNTDTPTTLSTALFRFSPTRAGDTTWKCVTDDGAAQTTNDSLVAPTTNVVLLEIEIISGQRVNFYIDGKLVKSNTTNLPAASASLRCQMIVEARDAAAHNIKFINYDTNS